MAPPSSKQRQDPKANNQIKSWLKYNLEDKSPKKKAGMEFESFNYPKKDNLINNLRFFINIAVSK